MLLNHLRSFHLTVHPSSSPENLLRVLISLPQICPHLSTSFHKFSSLPSTVSSVPTLQTRLRVWFLVYFSLTHSPALLCPLTDSLLATCRLPATTTSGEDSPLGNDAAQKTVTLQSAAGASVENWFIRVTSRTTPLLLLLLLLCLACRQKSACKSSVIAG